MTWVVDRSCRIYSATLNLYPAAMNRDFGAEMADVFRQDIDHAWRSQGFTGVVRVWSVAAWELLRFALPVQAAKPAIAVPAISLALSVTTWSATMQHALRRTLETGVLGLVEGFCSIVLWQSLLSAFIAFAAVSFSNLGAPVSLGLCTADLAIGNNPARNREQCSK